MKFQCEDLAQAGILLIRHDSRAFQHLSSDIRRHIEAPPPGSPPPFRDEMPNLPDEDNPASAILWNQSGKPICAYTLIWKFGWRDEFRRRPTTSTHILGVGHSPSLLLPFGLREDRRAFETYWHTILPDSKRYLDSDRVLGGNADVRAPAAEEQWSGGVIRWGGGERNQGDGADTVTLTLDAAFFSTGECAGPDTRQLWDRVIAEAELCQEVAAAARGGDAERILSEVEQITGDAANPPPPPGPPGRAAKPGLLRKRERWSLARRISHMRSQFGNDKTVSILRDWANVPLPQYRRS